jgi:hypothetical protein
MLHPRKCAPSLLNNPSISSLPFHDFRNKSDRKSHSLATNAQCTREKFQAKISPRENAHGPNNPLLQHQISHLERMLHGPDNPPLQQQNFGYNIENPFTIFSLHIR